MGNLGWSHKHQLLKIQEGLLHLMGFILQSSGGILELGYWIFMLWMIQSFCLKHVTSEPFEPSPFIPGVNKAFENDFNATTNWQQKEQSDADASALLFSANKKEISSTRANNVAKIKVVVRKRPLNKKEISRKEDDIVTVSENALTVREPKLKVDLTAYVEKHEFCFDAVLDEHVNNDEVYRATVEPIIPIIFQQTKATCFAYGQTGSGKMFTMQPLEI